MNSFTPTQRSAINLLTFVTFLVGAMLLMAPHLDWIRWTGLIVVSVTGFSCLLAMLTLPAFTTPWSVYATSLALGYGFGAFNTMARGYADGLDLLSVTYASPSGIALALGAVMILVSFMLFVGHRDRYKILPADALSQPEQYAAFTMLTVVALGGLLAFATGQIGYQGDISTEEGSARVSAAGAILTSSMTAVLGASAYTFANERRSTLRWLVIVMCGLIALMLLIQGRRIFMFGMLVALVGFFSARDVKAFLTFKSLIILVLVGASFFAASRGYMAMRMAGYSLGESPSLKERVRGAVEILQNAEMEGLGESANENETTRTFIVGYLAELIEASETRSVMWGYLLKLNVASSVPTVIWPGKWKILAEGGTEEYSCNPQMGMPIWDGPNSALTAGLCDFWWPGLFLYPVGLVLLYVAFNRALSKAPSLIRALVCFATIENLFQVESALTGYFVGIRNISVMLLIAWSLVLLFQWQEKLPWARHRAQRQAHKNSQGMS